MVVIATKLSMCANFFKSECLHRSFVLSELSGLSLIKIVKFPFICVCRKNCSTTMCIICSKRRLADKWFPWKEPQPVILGSSNLTSWRSSTMKLFRCYAGDDFRVEDLMNLSPELYSSLLEHAFRARVHPIYWPLLDELDSSGWDLHDLWHKIGDAYRNGPFMIYLWNQLLQKEQHSAACLWNDIFQFQHLINERNSIGILSSLYAAVPVELKSFALWDMANGFATLGRLKRRLNRLFLDPNISTEDLCEESDQEEVDEYPTDDEKPSDTLVENQSPFAW